MDTIQNLKGIIFFEDEITAADKEIILKDTCFMPDGEMHHESLRKDLERCIEYIGSKRVQTVLGFYFGIYDSAMKAEFPEQCGTFPRGMTLDVIGNLLGLTRERARQLKEKGLRNLRERKAGLLLRKYLG